jgi:hypothetical protein
MKKKNVSLKQKLFLNKEVLAELNTHQQQQALGGAGLSRKLPCVTQAGAGSCNTIPPMQEACIYC